MSHTCHSPDCERVVPPKMLFCRPHWFALPKNIQDAIWREYRPGQENDKKPSLRYLAVQQLACAHSVFKPNNEEAARKAAPYIRAALAYQEAAIEKKAGDPLEGLVSPTNLAKRIALK